MLSEIHFLLTYTCNLECDHCFVYSGPNAKGTFTLSQIREVLSELTRIGTIEWVYFEGGEPFQFYPLMFEGIKMARDLGFKTGAVTNAFWASSVEDAELWMKPLKDLGVSGLTVSDDAFHFENEGSNPAKMAIEAGRRLGLDISVICIEKLGIEGDKSKEVCEAAPAAPGGLFFRGRAADKLKEGQPTREWTMFSECPFENLRDPRRVHIDPFGFVHVCQGISIGNFRVNPLSQIVRDYNCDSHPILGPLAKGGPVLLAEKYHTEHDEEYIDACDFCYHVRLALLEKFPEYLAPRQVYGLK
jgi:hypothetical protein